MTGENPLVNFFYRHPEFPFFRYGTNGIGAPYFLSVDGCFEGNILSGCETEDFLSLFRNFKPNADTFGGFLPDIFNFQRVKMC